VANLIEKTILQNTGVPLFGKVADLTALRQKLIGSNIANVNTPGYRGKQMKFESELKKVLGSEPRISAKTTDPRHIPLGTQKTAPAKIKSDKSVESSSGINSVDVDKEMTNLVESQLMFDFVTRRLAGKFRGLKTAIRGRD